jgi:hypothetical protein
MCSSARQRVRRHHLRRRHDGQRQHVTLGLVVRVLDARHDDVYAGQRHGVLDVRAR